MKDIGVDRAPTAPTRQPIYAARQTILPIQRTTPAVSVVLKAPLTVAVFVVKGSVYAKGVIQFLAKGI